MKELDELIKNRDTEQTIVPPANNWTAKHKKHAIYTVEKDGKKVSIPVMDHLKKLGNGLPPMRRANKRLVHFVELRKLFMTGKTKEESMQLVKDYCNLVIKIWNDAAKTALNNKTPNKK